MNTSAATAWATPLSAPLSPDIEAQTCYFVPLGENLEIWKFQVTNRRRKPARLSIFSSIEFCLWDAQDDATNFQRNFSIGQVEVADGVIYHKTEYRERRNHFAWFACSARLAGFDTQRDVFLGPYRGWDKPAAVERGKSFNSIAHGWAPLGSHHVKVNLRPGETKEILFVLGYHENPRTRSSTRRRRRPSTSKPSNPSSRSISTAKNVAAAFEALREVLGRLLAIYQVQVARPARQPHGQYLERLPMHGHLQHVALGLLL